MTLSPLAECIWNDLSQFRVQYGFNRNMVDLRTAARRARFYVVAADMHAPIQEILDAGLVSPRDIDSILRSLLWNDKALRQTVWEKTGGTCFYCEQPFTKALRFGIDHIRPIAMGGDNRLENLVPSCQPCNVRQDRKPVILAQRGMIAA